MGNRTDQSFFNSPTEQFKMDILKLVNKIEGLDMDGDKRGYVNGVKHLYWKMIKYTPLTVRTYIQKLLNELDTEKLKIMDLDLTSEQKEKKYISIDYQYYNIICENITKVLSFSPIVEEEIVGILEVGDSIQDLRNINDMLRKTPKEKIELLDIGETEEGVEELDL